MRRTIAIIGILIMPSVLMGQVSDSLVNRDLLAGYSTLTMDDLENKDQFFEVLFNGNEIDESNFLKREEFIEDKNEFNSDWENRRIAHRTKMNEYLSRLLRSTWRYQLLESQIQGLEAEVRQLNSSLEDKINLEKKYAKTGNFLNYLRNNILNNYLYYGIFYTEYDIPSNNREVMSVHVEQLREYGEYKIKNTIKDSYINALVTDEVWEQNGILNVSKELIKEVEMVNTSVSFHISLKMGGRRSKQIVLAASLFKNEGIQDRLFTGDFNEMSPIQDFEILEEYKKSFKCEPLLTNSHRETKISKIYQLIEDSQDSDQIKALIRKRLDNWYVDAERALLEVDTEDARAKWKEELKNYQEASTRVDNAKENVRQEISEINDEILIAERKVKGLKRELLDAKSEWQSIDPQYDHRSGLYYKMVQYQVHYEVLDAKNTQTSASFNDAIYEAVSSVSEKLKDGRARELFKSVQKDINGYAEMDSKRIHGFVQIAEMAILGYDPSGDGSAANVNVKLGVKMILTIPNNVIKKQIKPLPPWKLYRFDRDTKIVTDVINKYEWKRFRLTKDEDRFGNDFLNDDNFPVEVKLGKWRVPNIEELLTLENALDSEPEELESFGILVNQKPPKPFWSNTESDNKDITRKFKKVVLITSEGVQQQEREITESGYFIFVRELNKDLP